MKKNPYAMHDDNDDSLDWMAAGFVGLLQKIKFFSHFDPTKKEIPMSSEMV